MDIMFKVEEVLILWIAMCATLGVLLFAKGTLDKKKK